MSKPHWYYRLHNPGGLLWWPGYLAWKWFKVCWTAHPLRRVATLDDCDMFWAAESEAIDPNFWESLETVELMTPPLTCIRRTELGSSAGWTLSVLAPDTGTFNSSVVICGCGNCTNVSTVTPL